MFSNLRQNATIYILHKGMPVRVSPCSVVSVSAPVPKFGMGQFGQPTAMEVDVQVSCNGETRNFTKLPANEDIATFIGENITLCTSREAVNAELEALKRRSLDIVNSFDFHKQMIASCEEAYASVNPEIAEKREQENLIKSLTERVAALTMQVEQMAKNAETKSAEISNDSKK